MYSKIISAFPGMGKTTMFENVKHLKCLDSDSSQFSWIEEDGNMVRNPEFPKNYIAHIKDNIGACDIIFVSTHKEVIQGLLSEGLSFNVFYPSIDDKELFISRYKDRGNPEQFIKLVDDNFEKFISDIDKLDGNNDILLIQTNSYISDYLDDENNFLNLYNMSL